MLSLSVRLHCTPVYHAYCNICDSSIIKHIVMIGAFAQLIRMSNAGSRGFVQTPLLALAFGVQSRIDAYS
jgi:hypothetical protein